MMVLSSSWTLARRAREASWVGSWGVEVLLGGGLEELEELEKAAARRLTGLRVVRFLYFGLDFFFFGGIVT